MAHTELGLRERRIIEDMLNAKMSVDKIAAAIRHKARGKTPNNKIHKAKRDYAVALVKENYEDFRPTLATEMLAEGHGLKVSRETLRKCALTHTVKVLACNRCRALGMLWRADPDRRLRSSLV